MIDKATDRNNNSLLLFILLDVLCRPQKFSQNLKIYELSLKIFQLLIKPRLKIMKSETYEYFEEIKKTLKDKEKLDIICNLQGQKASIAFSLNIKERIFIDTTLISIWNKWFKERLDVFGEKLFYIFQEYIREIYGFYHLLRKDSKITDSISDKRPAIERHYENNKNISDNQELHFILDIFSDVMSWVSLNSKHLTEIALKWIDLDVIWLKRFAVFAMEKTKFHIPTKKLDWLKSKKLIDDIQLYHEVCGLIKVIYSTTRKKDNKILLISLIKSLPSEKKSEALRYLYFLKKLFSNCNLIHTAINKLKDKSLDHQFMPHADFSFRHKIVSSEIIMGTGESIYSVDDLLKLNLAKYLEALLNWKARFNARHTLLLNIQKAIIHDFDWSLKLCDLLIEKSHQITDLWSSILQGWVESDLNEKQWKIVLSYLTNHNFILKNFFLSCIKSAFRRG